MTHEDIARLSDRERQAAVEGRVRECYVNHPVGTKCPNCATWPYKKGGADSFIEAVRAILDANDTRP